jgi:phosphatidylserine/phosphatidylglycerophosphate/cardiolipin synthase-like enzyme
MPIRKNGTVLTANQEPTPTPTITVVDIQPVVTHEPADPRERRISRAGLYQAALQSQGVMVHNSKDFQTYLDGVRRAAEEGLRWINDQ